jgi:hypothetical protein
MYGITPLILIVLQLFFQIIFGRKAIGEDIKWNFGSIVTLSIISQIILSVISFYVASYNFEKSLDGREYRCGMGLLGIVAISLLFTVFLLITILIQYFIKKYYDKNK